MSGDSSIDQLLLNMEQPPCRHCSDCKTKEFDINLNGGDDNTVMMLLKLCDVHSLDFWADPRRPLTTPDPDSPAGPLLPGAQRTIPSARAAGRPAPAALRNVVSVPVTRTSPTRSRSRSPSSRSPSSPAPSTSRSRVMTSRNPSRLRSRVPAAALDLYMDVKRLVLHRSGGHSVPEACKTLKISERTLARKAHIAELMILDNDKFESVLGTVISKSQGRKFSQEKLCQACDDVLQQPEYRRKRRAAVASGELF